MSTKLTDLKIDEMAENFGKKLNGEKKVAVKIPFDSRNPGDKVVPVCLNGYIFEIKRGEKIEVPASIAAILEEAKYI